MSLERFNTKRFIEEVYKRPCLWNNTTSEFPDRHLKYKYWEEIVDVFNEFDRQLTSYEKERRVETLQRRWKSIRGCFTRELLRKEAEVSRCETDPELPRKREYLYFKQLQFLNKTVTKKERDPLHVTNSEEDSPSKRMRKRYRVNQPQQETSRLVGAEKASIESKDKCECSNQDEDRLFMLSLVNTLKRVPLEKKMATKIHIMSILDDATNVAPEVPRLSPTILKVEHFSEIL
ncbi:unnamed protein product [Chrysodeixis includens]|uniref:MADF domain-containing protein n=1 Tax=Chrysodeixis includens TaxID=689277 RepID=A0A9N8L437_CHRIL|nr:unnamed protein product [Chrysodeixis includens]